MPRRVRHGRANRRQEAELNITAFMNLMVVLVPFLLIMAVFTRLTIVQLDLPSANVADQPEPPVIQLEAILRADRLDLEDRGKQLLATFPMQDNQYDFKALSQRLRQIKTTYPAVKAISVLAEDDVNYDSIIRTMDTVRSLLIREDDKLEEYELFPEISLGKAPLPLPIDAETNEGDAQ